MQISLRQIIVGAIAGMLCVASVKSDLSRTVGAVKSEQKIPFLLSHETILLIFLREIKLVLLKDPCLPRSTSLFLGMCYW